MSSHSTVYEHVWQSLLMSESPGSSDPWCNVCVCLCVFVLLAVLLPPAQGVCAFPFMHLCLLHFFLPSRAMSPWFLLLLKFSLCACRG